MVKNPQFEIRTDDDYALLIAEMRKTPRLCTQYIEENNASMQKTMAAETLNTISVAMKYVCIFPAIYGAMAIATGGMPLIISIGMMMGGWAGAASLHYWQKYYDKRLQAKGDLVADLSRSTFNPHAELHFKPAENHVQKGLKNNLSTAGFVSGLYALGSYFGAQLANKDANILPKIAVLFPFILGTHIVADALKTAAHKRAQKEVLTEACIRTGKSVAQMRLAVS